VPGSVKDTSWRGGEAAKGDVCKSPGAGGLPEGGGRREYEEGEVRGQVGKG